VWKNPDFEIPIYVSTARMAMIPLKKTTDNRPGRGKVIVVII
jgi:hypothetical protein